MNLQGRPNMTRTLLLTCAALAVAAPVASARPELQPGNYIVYVAPEATTEHAVMLLKVARRGGREVADVLEPTKNAHVESVKVEDRNVTLVFKAFGRTLTFEGAIDPKDDKVIVGNFGEDRSVS